MPAYPTRQEQEALCKLLTDYKVRGETEQPVLEALFALSQKAAPKPMPPIETKELADKLHISIDGIKAGLARLRNTILPNFFSQGIGINEPIKACISPIKIALYFEHNPDYSATAASSVSGNNDSLARFWAPYRDSNDPAVLYYPEPVFFRDDRQSYLRNLEVKSTENSSALQYLKFEGMLVPTYSYVPAGFVKAIVHFQKLFFLLRKELLVKVLPEDPKDWHTDLQHENVIVLGGPSANPAIMDALLGKVPISSGREAPDGENFRNVFRVQGQSDPYIDQVQIQHDQAYEASLQKWAVLTRRVHRRTNVMTVLNGHSRSVEAIAEFLTMTSDLERLLKGLTQSSIANEYQVLFGILMKKYNWRIVLDDSERAVAIHHSCPLINR